MKILVLGLLRMGDLIMMAPTFRGLKEQYPEAEVHVVINRECRAICPLIGHVDRWIELDRQSLQKSLGEFDGSFFDGFAHIQQLVQELEAQEYAFAINLTHTRLSGWLAGLLNCEIRAGLGLTGNGRSFIASGWFRYLNDHAEASFTNGFHYADIFYLGSGLASSWHPIELNETEAGIAEAAAIQSDSPYILVQALTSEEKKTWSLESYAQALRVFAVLHPDREILLLGAPFEREQLTKLEARLISLRVRARLALVSLEGALSLCRHAQLVITGDTSIKHMASSKGCRVLEISLGSSQFQRTGVYSPDNVILQAKEPCAPCPHSGPCSRPTHACSERISPECVALSASKLLQRDFAQLKIVAEQYRDEVSVYRTEWSESGMWQAVSLCEMFGKPAIANWIERVSWQLYLMGEHRQQLGEFGSHSLRLARVLQQIFPRQSRADWQYVLRDLEYEINQHLNGPLEHTVPARGEDFVKARQKRDQTESVNQRREIELKIVRTLRTEMEK